MPNIKELEQELFKSVEDKTPEYIKSSKLLSLDNENEFVFKLKREHLLPYDEKTNPQGLDLKNWLKNYEKEAKVSTAGIRGPQNILYPHDTRFPINLIGIMLATVAKALVANEKYKGKKLRKILGREVRYNSDKIADLIARVQSACGIETLMNDGRKTMPIWLASFLAFQMDLLGGEYITSSHGISVKNATKDLNSQGSQYLPEESMEFVNKIKEIFTLTEKNGEYEIKIASRYNPLINESILKSLNNGLSLYKKYLENGVANKTNLDLIKNADKKIVIENVGGSAYRTLSVLLKELDIEKTFDWLNVEEDPFFHGIGKYNQDPKGNKCFYDYSVDATVVSKDSAGNPYFPVIKSMCYDVKLAKYPIGTVIFITDPDHDRLTVCQIEDEKNINEIEKAGVDYIKLNEGRILSVLTANQSFLLIMDFWTKKLKETGKFREHPRFIIKTTASAKSWDEWAQFNDIKVVNVPVGFKEIANIMKKVEKQIKDNPDRAVVVTDVLGNDINLGINPRLIFAGEESGGMIIGAEELIKSQHGRFAIAMREKSATEAIIVASALASELEKSNKTFSKALYELFEQNKIVAKFDIREDIAYYNESEPDIEKLKQAKVEGEAKRTKNDLFYLTLAFANYEKVISLGQIKEIFNDTFKELNFDNLEEIKFVGDGTYLKFDNKFIEIRPSGTDAKTKAYGAGDSKDEIKIYAKILGNYSGNLTENYKKYISNEYYQNVKDKSMKKYLEFTNKDANNEGFEAVKYII